MKRKAYKLKKDLRVTLVCRIAPETMRRIKLIEKQFGGRGRALDRMVERIAGSTFPRREEI